MTTMAATTVRSAGLWTSTLGIAKRSVLKFLRTPQLVVLGTHGRTGLSHVLLGSVAERLIRYSPVPVLTVPPPGRT